MPRKTTKRANGFGSKPTQRGESFQVRVTLGRKPDGTLDRRSVSGKTPEEAELKAKELVVAYGRGTVGDPSEITFQEFAKTWLKREAKSLDKKTQNTYKTELEYIMPYIGKMRLQGIKPVHISHGLDAVAERKDPRTGQPFAIRTIRKTLQRVKAVFDEALRLELVHRNPASAIKRKGKPSEDVGVALEFEQVATLLGAAKDLRYHLAVYLSLSMGLRKGEVLGLKWSDVDFQRHELHVRRSRGRDEGTPKTETSKRTIPLTSAVITELQKWKAKVEEEKKVVREDYTHSPYVLVTCFGKPIAPREPNTTLEYALNKLEGFPHIRFHDLRHTCATLWLQAGIPVEVVGKWLGHADPSITMKIYRHVLQSELSHYAARMPELPTFITSEKVHVGAALEQNATNQDQNKDSAFTVNAESSVPDATLAERERFELSVQRLTTHPLSRRTP
jgi:integrase